MTKALLCLWAVLTSVPAIPLRAQARQEPAVVDEVEERISYLFDQWVYLPKERRDALAAEYVAKFRSTRWHAGYEEEALSAFCNDIEYVGDIHDSLALYRGWAENDFDMEPSVPAPDLSELDALVAQLNEVSPRIVDRYFSALARTPMGSPEQQRRKQDQIQSLMDYGRQRIVEGLTLWDSDGTRYNETHFPPIHATIDKMTAQYIVGAGKPYPMFFMRELTEEEIGQLKSEFDARLEQAIIRRSETWAKRHELNAGRTTRVPYDFDEFARSFNVIDMLRDSFNSGIYRLTWPGDVPLELDVGPDLQALIDIYHQYEAILNQKNKEWWKAVDLYTTEEAEKEFGATDPAENSTETASPSPEESRPSTREAELPPETSGGGLTSGRFVSGLLLLTALLAIGYFAIRRTLR